MKVAAVSGYKPFELGIFQLNHPAIAYIKKAIRKNVELLIENGLEWIIISGQLGVELWAAEVVFELQQTYPDLKLAVITPFLHQEEKWNGKNRDWYETILAQADFIDAITKKRYEKPWQFRLKNQFFIEKSEALILLYDDEKGGSPKFLFEAAKQYQMDHSYDILIISFEDLQAIAEEEDINQHGFS